MEDVNGKEISLQYVTVKVPGQKPRGSKSIITTVPGYNHTPATDIHDSIGGLSLGELRWELWNFWKNMEIFKTNSEQYSFWKNGMKI